MKWIEASRHDISVLPGGGVLHHSTCRCREKRAKGLNSDTAKQTLILIGALLWLVVAIWGILEVVQK